MTERKHHQDALVYPLAMVVMIGWLGALAVGAYTGSYIALTLVSPLMLALAGYVFGVQLVRRSDNGG